VHELQRLKGLYDGFGYRELARIVFHRVEHRIDPKTVQALWEDLSPAAPQQLPLLDYHSYADPVQARRRVIELYFEGWRKRSISEFLHVSRPTINAWIERFEADNVASLEDQSRAPSTTRRKAWLPTMVEIYHLQKRHPDAGGFRIWSLRGKTDLSRRTIERIMAINRQVYRDIPHGSKQRKKRAPQPHPFKAAFAHEYWFIDGEVVESHYSRWVFTYHAGGRGSPLRGQLGRADSAVYGMSALWGAPPPHLGQRRGLYLRSVRSRLCAPGH
jgi:hypothetical protein